MRSQEKDKQEEKGGIKHKQIKGVVGSFLPRL